MYDEDTSFYDGFAICTHWAEAQPVEDSTCQGTYSLIQKQVRSLGCPFWSDVQSWIDADGLQEDALITCYYCADGGPDQAATKKVGLHETMDCANTVFLPTDCFDHHNSLTILALLKQVDYELEKYGLGEWWRFYASVCMMMKVLRVASAEVFNVWSGLFGPVAARNFAKRVWPNCIAIRWAQCA